MNEAKTYSEPDGIFEVEEIEDETPATAEIPAWLFRLRYMQHDSAKKLFE